jgi:hypothetical protein
MLAGSWPKKVALTLASVAEQCHEYHPVGR